PKIEAPVTIESFLARKEKFDLSLVGSLQKERRHPREIFHEFEKQNGRLPKNVGVWIGPEGDFTMDELKAIENSGAFPISLGNLVLRVETAAIYCLSILNCELQRD
ncbi:MAG TPA: RsmE family RNA methyltransferase, partial [Verrucomicrobiae bacterium]|nr:RsmE family RNA methyltransferase [Verrucomicrobiae bacterium]